MKLLQSVRSALLVAWLAVLATGLPGTGRAADWTQYDLPGIAFAVPADWAVTYSSRDTEYDFASPDGTYQLWVRWWFPDEPLTGWDDIVFQQNTVLAGKSALLIRHEITEERTLQIAFPNFRNEDGEIPLVQLIAPIRMDLASHERMMIALAQALVVDGQPATLPDGTLFGGPLGEPHAGIGAAPPTSGVQTAPAGQTGTGMGFHYDAAADISLPRPAGWDLHTASGGGVTQLAVVPPEGNVLALAIFGAQADADMVMGYLYRDSIVVKSIEGESYPTIAGQPAHAIETIAKVYTINGIALPYTRGRVRIIQGGTPQAYYILVTIRPEDAPEALTRTLDDVANGFLIGPPPAGGPGVSPDPASASIPVLPVADAAQAKPATVWAATVQSRFDGHCRFLDLERWTHPTRPVIEDAGAKIDFVALCREDTYPVFGVRFPYDPRAATDDYFHPLYANTFLANGGWDFSFLEVDDGVLLSLRGQGDSLALDIEDLPRPTAQTIALPVVPMGAPAPSAQQQRPVLFDGASLTGWEMLTAYGGNAEDHSLFGLDALAVTIPDKMGWALVGLRSTAPVIALPPRGAAQAMMLRAEVDPAATDTLFLALADAEQIGLEPWSNFDLRLQMHRDADGHGRYRLDRDGAQAVTSVAPWPDDGVFTVTLRPDGVLALRNAAGTALLRADIPVAMQGKDWFLRAYVRPTGKNSPARLTLRRLVLDEVTPQPDPEAERLAFEPIVTVLFDGHNTLPLWDVFEGYEGYFRAHAKVDGGLVIDRAAETDNVRLGLASVEPALWLDHFTGAAEAILRVDLDGARSTGLDLTLGERVGLDDQGRFAFRLWFERDPTLGTVTLHMLSPQSEEGVHLPGLTEIPDHVVLRLTPGWIRAEIDGVIPLDLPFASAREGAGLRMMVLGHGLPKSDETRLTLNRITAERHPGNLPRPAIPRIGVQPLPVRVLMDGAPGTDWLRQAPGGLVFDELAQARPDGIRLFRQDTPKNGNRLALVSAEPVLVTDRRIARTPLAVTIQMDPSDPELAARFVLTSAPDPERGVEHEVTLAILREGPQAGRLMLGLLTGHFSYDHWTRTLPEGWQANWDGTLSIALGDGLITATLGARDGRPVTLSAQSDRAAAEHALHLAILPGTRAQYDPGGVTLHRIAVGWRTPDAMDAVTRQELLDADAFSPEAWLAGLRDLIDEETLR